MGLDQEQSFENFEMTPERDPGLHGGAPQPLLPRGVGETSFSGCIWRRPRERLERRKSLAQGLEGTHSCRQRQQLLRQLTTERNCCPG